MIDGDIFESLKRFQNQTSQAAKLTGDPRICSLNVLLSFTILMMSKWLNLSGDYNYYLQSMNLLAKKLEEFREEDEQLHKEHLNRLVN